jgi:hypothetical protein
MGQDLKKISTLITGTPSCVSAPKLREGESLIHFLIRTYPKRWNNFIENTSYRFPDQRDVCKKLRSSAFDGIDPVTCDSFHWVVPLSSLPILDGIDPLVCEELEKWINYQVPTIWRTMHDLLYFKEHLVRQIFWLQSRRGDDCLSKSEEEQAREMGIEVIGGEDRNISAILGRAEGSYIWTVPGGSNVSAWVESKIVSILVQMESDMSIAQFYDRHYSFIYRVSALKEIAERLGFLSPDPDEIARDLRKLGYRLFMIAEDESPLCTIEEIYGGPPYPPRQGKSWLRRILGI